MLDCLKYLQDAVSCFLKKFKKSFSIKTISYKNDLAYVKINKPGFRAKKTKFPFPCFLFYTGGQSTSLVKYSGVLIIKIISPSLSIVDIFCMLRKPNYFPKKTIFTIHLKTGE